MDDDFRKQLADAEQEVTDAEASLVEATEARKEAQHDVKMATIRLRRLLREELHPDDRPLIAEIEKKAEKPYQRGKPSPEDLIAVACPKCGADVREPCVDDGHREPLIDSLDPDSWWHHFDRRLVAEGYLKPVEKAPDVVEETPSGDGTSNPSSDGERGSTAPLRPFHVLGRRTGKPIYSVMAESVQDAEQLNRLMHPADADLGIRALRSNEKIVLPTFDRAMFERDSARPSPKPAKPKRAKKAKPEKPKPVPGAAARIFDQDDAKAVLALESAQGDDEGHVDHFDRVNSEIKVKQPRRKAAARA